MKLNFYKALDRFYSFCFQNKKNAGEENGAQTSGPPKLTRFSTWPNSGPKEKPPEEPPKLTRAVHWPDREGDEAYTSVHINKEHKQVQRCQNYQLVGICRCDYLILTLIVENDFYIDFALCGEREREESQRFLFMSIFSV